MQIWRERENLLEVFENNHIGEECTVYNKRFGASGN